MTHSKPRITLKDFKKAVNKGMKVLHIDTENSPNLSYHFGTRDLWISEEQIIIPSQTISFQWRWEHEPKAKYVQWKRVGSPNLATGDSGFCSKTVLEVASALINEADIVVGQNLNGFDYKMLQAALKDNQLHPLENDKTIDILSLSRRSFRQEHHSLDARARRAFNKQKIKMSIGDWIDVSTQKTKVEDKMGPYGLKDVNLGRDLFHHEFEYYKNFPAKIEKIIRSFLEDPRIACPKCAARRQARFNTVPMAGSNKYTCLNCNHIFKVKKR
jgi:hypothetical protein